MSESFWYKSDNSGGRRKQKSSQGLFLLLGLIPLHGDAAPLLQRGGRADHLSPSFKVKPLLTYFQGKATSHLFARYLQRIIHVSLFSLLQGDRLVPRLPAFAQPVLIWAFSPPSPSFSASLVHVTSVSGEKIYPCSNSLLLNQIPSFVFFSFNFRRCRSP